jgi:hypothetical protein
MVIGSESLVPGLFSLVHTLRVTEWEGKGVVEISYTDSADDSLRVLQFVSALSAREIYDAPFSKVFERVVFEMAWSPKRKK